MTDLKKYNVGTAHPADVGPYDPIYDTPTLHELWRSGPYLHDGSAATLRDVLTTQNTSDLHGVTAHLTTDQVDDLVAYLEQIGGIENWVNGAPLVHAGPDQILTPPATNTQLAAVAQDEGLPAGLMTLNWSLQSGPAPVVFGDANLPATTATFTAPGAYVLQCTASDGDAMATNTVLITVNAAGNPNDTDSDGMGDAWENHYFGGLSADNAGPNDDWDSDGLSNVYEYLTGTDPTDPNSGFHLEIAKTGGQIVVRFSAHAAGTALTPGSRLFTLQSSVTTSGQLTWSDVPGHVDVLGADQLVEWSGPAPEAVQLFRVRVRLEP